MKTTLEFIFYFLIAGIITALSVDVSVTSKLYLVGIFSAIILISLSINVLVWRYHKVMIDYPTEKAIFSVWFLYFWFTLIVVTGEKGSEVLWMRIILLMILPVLWTLAWNYATKSVYSYFKHKSTNHKQTTNYP